MEGEGNGPVDLFVDVGIKVGRDIEQVGPSPLMMKVNGVESRSKLQSSLVWASNHRLNSPESASGAFTKACSTSPAGSVNHSGTLI